MKIEESPAKQQAVKRHIEQVVEKKISQVEKAYRSNKEAFVKKNYENKKREAERTLKPLIASLKKAEETLLKEAEKINYSMGTYELYGSYNADDKLCIHELKEYNIEHALEDDFDEKNEAKRDSLKEQIENKKLEVIEKILFADEQELMKLISELKAIKVEL